MTKRINMIGRKINKLKVIKFFGIDKCNQAMWFCKCDCGNTKIVSGNSLRRGHTKSCGCLCKETVGKMFRTHGKSKTAEFYIWASMKDRCKDRNDKLYGGRGIKVCKRWHSFKNFYKDMGERPNGKTIPTKRSKISLERIDNNKGYKPSNCKWATIFEQSRNTRRNRIIVIDGVAKILEDWMNDKKLSRYMILKKYGS